LLNLTQPDDTLREIRDARSNSQTAPETSTAARDRERPNFSRCAEDQRDEIAPFHYLPNAQDSSLI
jgi:hypothetical protein